MTINTSQGQFRYINAAGARPTWYKIVSAGRGTQIVDPAVIQRLNEIAQQQATP